MDDQDRTIANTVRIAQQGGIGNLLDLDFDAPTTATFSPMKGAAPSYAPSIGTQGGLDDLLGMMDDLPTSSPQNFGANNSSPMSWSSSPTSSSSFVFPKTLVLDAVSSQGLNLLASFSRRNGRIFIDFTFSNKSTLVLSDFAIQFNNNSYLKLT